MGGKTHGVHERIREQPGTVGILKFHRQFQGFLAPRPRDPEAEPDGQTG